MPTTRLKVLQFLETYQPASIREIGKALGLSDPDILYHIQLLLDHGEIELAQRDAGSFPRRGRPMKRYRLKHPAHPENYVFLSQSLLQALAAGWKTDEEKQAGLKALAHAFLPLEKPRAALSSRLVQLAGYFSQRQYAARWEAHALGPQLIFANCPYQAVACTCRELCLVDQYAIEAFMGTPVSMQQNFFDANKSTRQCRFLLSI